MWGLLVMGVLTRDSAIGAGAVSRRIVLAVGGGKAVGGISEGISEGREVVDMGVWREWWL